MTGGEQKWSNSSNNRVESARVARPTRKGDAPSLAAHAGRWAVHSEER